MTKFRCLALTLVLLSTLALVGCEQVSDEFDEIIGREAPSDIGDDRPLYDLNGHFNTDDSQGCATNRGGGGANVSPSDVKITQTGNHLIMELISTGDLAVGRVSGNRFYVSNSGRSRISQSHCDYEFFGIVHDDNSLNGEERADCV
jgi:hypothetical protein